MCECWFHGRQSYCREKAGYAGRMEKRESKLPLEPFPQREEGRKQRILLDPSTEVDSSLKSPAVMTRCSKEELVY